MAESAVRGYAPLNFPRVHPPHSARAAIGGEVGTQYRSAEEVQR